MGIKQNYNYKNQTGFNFILSFLYMITLILIMPNYLGISKASTAILLSSVIFIPIIGMQTMIIIKLYFNSKDQYLKRKEYIIYQFKFLLSITLCTSFVSFAFYLFGF